MQKYATSKFIYRLIFVTDSYLCQTELLFKPIDKNIQMHIIPSNNY